MDNPSPGLSSPIDIIPLVFNIGRPYFYIRRLYYIYRVSIAVPSLYRDPLGDLALIDTSNYY